MGDFVAFAAVVVGAFVVFGAVVVVGAFVALGSVGALVVFTLGAFVSLAAEKAFDFILLYFEQKCIPCGRRNISKYMVY